MPGTYGLNPGPPASFRPHSYDQIKNISCFVLLLISISLVNACKNDEEPVNPFYSIDHSSPLLHPKIRIRIPLQDSTKIFSPWNVTTRVAMTVLSNLISGPSNLLIPLLYQPVNKLTLDSARFFNYRTIPNNVADSWLIERLTTSTTEYMPSNGIRLSASDIDHVKNWINAGCPDMNGVVAVNQTSSQCHRFCCIRSKLEPTILTASMGIRSTIPGRCRKCNANCIYHYWYSGWNLSYWPITIHSEEIHFSLDKDDFSNSSVLVASTYLSPYSAWLAILPSVNWPAGTIVYFRIYVNDGHHSNNTEFPRFDSPDYYKTYFFLSMYNKGKINAFWCASVLVMQERNDRIWPNPFDWNCFCQSGFSDRIHTGW